MTVYTFANSLPKVSFDASGDVILTEEFLRAAIENAPSLQEFEAETNRRLSLSREQIIASHTKRTWGDVINDFIGRKRSSGPGNSQP